VSIFPLISARQAQGAPAHLLLLRIIEAAEAVREWSGSKVLIEGDKKAAEQHGPW
jgi:hypothetical protein